MSVLVLALSGSLRRGSYNTGLLRAAADAAPAGVAVELYEGLAGIPPYSEDEDVDEAAEAVLDLRERITAADALLFATPEYNASIPGQLKTAVDWASRPYGASAISGRPAAVVGASTGPFGALRAQEELRKVLRTGGARVIEKGLAVPHAHERFDALGGLDSPALRVRLSGVLEALVESAQPPVAAAA